MRVTLSLAMMVNSDMYHNLDMNPKRFSTWQTSNQCLCMMMKMDLISSWLSIPTVWRSSTGE